MSIKKFTVAAAIAAGMTAMSLSSVMAETISQRTCGQGACPLEQSGMTIDQAYGGQPVCAACNSAEDASANQRRQVYSYPNAVYGANNYVGETSNSIYTAQTPMSTATNLAESNGVTIVSNGSLTGAASSIPVLNDIQIVTKNAPANPNAIQITTESSMDVIKKSFSPFDLNAQPGRMTGAAANIASFFPDVPENYWASCDIDKLAMNDVVVGYPDKLYKPGREVSRAEFATMLVKGFDMDGCPGCLEPTNIFKDVPTSNWANPMIAKAVQENLMKGYPNGTFKPNSPVSRAEALSAMSKGLDTPIDSARAQEILSQYQDANKLPSWAQIPVATALDAGALKDTKSPYSILPAQDATRAEIAAMLQAVRVAGGYDKNPMTATAGCPAAPLPKQAFVETETIVKVPTLRLEFLDQINAKSSYVGERFAAMTLEDVTINGQLYPAGSKATGKVIEIIRPNGKETGALKLAFTEIEHDGAKAELPQQILTAQIDNIHNPNAVARFVAMPFTWAGSLVGIVGRSAGGMLSNVGNAVENISSGVGMSLSEAFQGEFKAAGRSLGDAGFQTVKAPVDFVRTAVSGTMGLFASTGDEFAYLVDPNGNKISAVNPRETITVAFGCNE